MEREDSVTIESIQKRIHADPYNPGPYLDLAQAYLETGQDAKARDVVLRRHRMPSGDSVIHEGWAGLCEELGMARQARECYENALRADPEKSDIMYRFAVFLSEIGHFEKSLHYLKKAVKGDPGNEKARVLLAENYRTLGLEGQAEVVAPKTKEPPSPSRPRYFAPQISDKHTARFLSLFAGREVDHAIQAVDSSTGQVSYRYQKGPLTHSLVASHLLGQITVSGYSLRSDNTVRYAAVAFRVPRKVFEANLKNAGYLAYLEERTRHEALMLQRHTQKLGLPTYVEDSGALGHRLWFFFSEPTHFLKVKRFLAALLEDVQRPDGQIAREPILATKPVGIGWMEWPVVLPLGVERTTLRRSLFLDSDGKPYEEQLKVLRRIREIPSGALRVNHCKSGFVASASPLNTHNMPRPIRVLQEECAVVRELVRKAFSGRLLRQEEKVILFYTLGVVDRDGDSLHRLFEPCPDYDYEKVQRQAARLQSNPISCVRIRELVPEITASMGCSCAFDLRGGKYPSPVLHVNPHLVPAAEAFIFSDSMPVRDAARRYVNLKRQSEEITCAMERLESLLDKQFSKKGIDFMKVGKVTLRRDDDRGKTNWRLECG